MDKQKALDGARLLKVGLADNEVERMLGLSLGEIVELRALAAAAPAGQNRPYGKGCKSAGAVP